VSIQNQWTVVMNKSVPNLIKGARRVRTPGMLSAGAEQDLIRAWQEDGDHHARDTLVAAFAPLAASVAKRFMRGAGEADPDLMQQANIGLMKAADRFDRGRGIRFATYAVWWVRAEVQAYARANGSVVRRPNSAHARAASARAAAFDAGLAEETGMAPADGLVPTDDGGPEAAHAADLMAEAAGADQSLNVPAVEDGGEDRIALLVDPASLDEAMPLRRLEAATLRRALVEALADLPERERDIIVATQIREPPATLEGLGLRYGVSKERVRQLRERGFQRLRATLNGRGLTAESFI
jgi:RNA polymerase sigma-32 factor